MHNEATKELDKIKNRDRMGKRQPKLKVAEATKENVLVRHQRKNFIKQKPIYLEQQNIPWIIDKNCIQRTGMPISRFREADVD